MKYLKMLGWLTLYGLAFLLAQIASGVALGAIYIIQSILAGEALPFEEYILSNVTLALIISGLLTLLFAMLLLFIKRENPLKYLEFRRLKLRDTILMAIIGAGCALFLNSLFTIIQIDRFLDDPISEQVAQMLTANMVMAFLAIGIVVPIYEEIFVRGLIFKELRSNLNLWVAIVLQGLIFGLIHGNMLQFSYTFPIGVLLGILFIQYSSIWAPITIHLVWNSTSLLMGAVIPEYNPIIFALILVLGGIMFIGGTIYAIRLGPPLLPKIKNPHTGDSTLTL